MEKARLTILGIFATGISLLLLGCNNGRDGGKPNDPAAVNDLKAIGIAFHQHNEAHQRGPQNAEELRPHVDAIDKSAFQGLQDGRYVFIWNVRLLDMQPTDQTVLAYEKDVPTKGGPVLFADGSVRTLSAEEFKSAKLAKPKG